MKRNRRSGWQFAFEAMMWVFAMSAIVAGVEACQADAGKRAALVRAGWLYAFEATFCGFVIEVARGRPPP